MDNIMSNVTGIAMAIVGVALLYTLVNPQNKTAEVIKSASGGFAQALGAAMGNQVSRPSIMGA